MYLQFVLLYYTISLGTFNAIGFFLRQYDYRRFAQMSFGYDDYNINILLLLLYYYLVLNLGGGQIYKKRLLVFLNNIDVFIDAI